MQSQHRCADLPVCLPPQFSLIREQAEGDLRKTVTTNFNKKKKNQGLKLTYCWAQFVTTTHQKTLRIGLLHLIVESMKWQL